MLEEDSTGWWKGQSKDGLVGFFPSNFSELIVEEEAGSGLRRMSMAPKPVRENVKTAASESSEEHVKAKHNYK